MAYNNLAISKQYLNEVKEAENLYLQAIALNNNAVEPLRNLGRLYFIQQRYVEAIEKLQRAVELGDFVSRSHLGHALYWNGDQAQANSVWEELIGIAKTRIDIGSTDGAEQTLYTDALVALGRYDEAVPEIEKTEAYAEEFPALVPSYLGRIYEQLGQRDRAMENIKKAFEARADFVLIDQDPWLEDLRTDPEYQELSSTYRPN